ncbi:MAG: preprotein translocase subunit SecG [Pseudomarimonas sp.]
MLLTIANVVYVLVSIAMVVLILLQRGAGAAAGSGFGGGASATVFGSRGSGNFLSKSTAVLATLFFAISLGMAVYANRTATATVGDADDLGVMGGIVAPSEVPPAESTDLVAPAESSEVPAAATPTVTLPEAAPAASELPAAEAGDKVEVETPPASN